MNIWINFSHSDQPTELFKKSIIVEVINAGFDKSVNINFFTLRFSQIQKIHRNQSFRDTLSFSEYQRLAKVSRASIENEDERVKKHWLIKLKTRSESENPRYDSVTSQKTTQNTESINSSSDTESL
jgi:DNA ligase-4